MKKLLTVFLISMLSGVGMNSLGAEPETSGEYDFNVNEGTCLYNRLGFGSREVVLQFMTNQVQFLRIGVYEENGNGGFDQTIPAYPGYNHPDYAGTETLEGFVLRASKIEFQRSVEKYNYRVDQRFTLKYFFLNFIRQIRLNINYEFLFDFRQKNPNTR